MGLFDPGRLHTFMVSEANFHLLLILAKCLCGTASEVGDLTVCVCVYIYISLPAALSRAEVAGD